jgi:hypothetical protein
MSVHDCAPIVLKITDFIAAVIGPLDTFFDRCFIHSYGICGGTQLAGFR